MNNEYDYGEEIGYPDDWVYDSYAGWMPPLSPEDLKYLKDNNLKPWQKWFEGIAALKKKERGNNGPSS